MKKRTIGKSILCAAVLGIGMLICTQQTDAKEMPSKKQWKQYESDGTLKQRIQYYKNAGGESYSKGLIRKKNTSGIATYSNLPGNETRYMPSEGEARVLLLRVDFPDVGFEEGDTEEALKNIAFGGAAEDYTAYPYESLQAYYERSSYGKLHITGDTISYTAQHEKSYYETAGITALYQEALEAVDPVVDFSQYDGNDDGYIDGLYMHFAGDDSGWGSIWWSIAYMGDIDGEYDGKYVGGYVTLHERSDSKQGVQTLIHETGHLLGLQDYYNYEDQIYENGLSAYDMMMDNSGDHNAFSKWLLGWIEEDEIRRVSLSDETSVEETITLDSLSKEKGNENKYKCAIISPKDEGMFSEYLMVEYDTEVGNQTGLRRNNGKLPDGFRVFHINAVLSEDGNFQYNNSGYIQSDPKLIVALDKDQSEVHSTSFQEDDLSLTEVCGGGEKYDCKYLAQDRLTPDTTPSTDLRNGQVLHKSGISFDRFQPDGDTGEVQVRLEKLEPSGKDLNVTIEETWRDISQSNVILLPVSMQGDAEINDEKPPYLVDKDGNKTEGILSKGGEEGKYFIIIQSDNLAAGEYECVLPEGAVSLNETVESEEQKAAVHVSENMKLLASDTLNISDSLIGCKDGKDGWYVLAPKEDDETKAHLYHISKEGKVTDQTTDIKDWTDAWEYVPEQMGVSELFCMDDGTLVMTFYDYNEEQTILVHIDRNGTVLDEKETLPGNGWKLYAVGNTIKAVNREIDEEECRFYSIKFGNEKKELAFQADDTYLFMTQGYLVSFMKNKAGEDADENDMWRTVEYRDEQDNTVSTWEFPYGDGSDEMNLVNIAGACENDSSIYLLNLVSDGKDEYRDGHWLQEAHLIMYSIDKKTGKFQKEKVPEETIRKGYSTTMDSDLDLYEVSEQNGKILFSVRTRFSEGEAPVIDTYCLEKDGTISKRISRYYSSASMLSAANIMEIEWTEEHPKFMIYDTGAQAEDPKTPENPKTPEDPKTPENPETLNQQKTPKKTDNAGAKKASKAKTGDTAHIWLYGILLAVSGGIVAVKQRGRRKE